MAWDLSGIVWLFGERVKSLGRVHAFRALVIALVFGVRANSHLYQKPFNLPALYKIQAKINLKVRCVM
jgi:hypothetical protein